MRQSNRRFAKLVATVAVTLASSSAWACPTLFMEFAPIPTPKFVQPDVTITYWVLRTDFETTLVNENGEEFGLEPLEFHPPSYATQTPVEPLPEGTYTLTATSIDSTQTETLSFTVDETAIRRDFAADVSVESRSRPSGNCINTPWAADVELSDAEGLEFVAFFLHRFELENGELVELSGGWETLFNGIADPGVPRSTKYSVDLDDSVQCASVTAVLTTGEQVPLGRSCDPSVSGGCATGSGAPEAPAALIVFAIFAVRRRRSRCPNDRCLR